MYMVKKGFMLGIYVTDSFSRIDSVRFGDNISEIFIEIVFPGGLPKGITQYHVTDNMIKIL